MGRGLSVCVANKCRCHHVTSVRDSPGMAYRFGEGVSKIKVAIADDHPVVLIGIRSILSDAPDIEVIYEAEEVKDLLAKVADQPPDVLVCDYEFDEDEAIDGLHLLGRLVRLAPGTRVLLLSSHSATHIVSTALAGGAAGFVGKTEADFAVLVDAIRRVHRGETYVPPSIASALFSNVFGSNASRSTGITALSPRELEVVRLICMGYSISEVAQRMNRSPKTVSNQKNSAMKKLAARNDVELAKAARDLGIV
jgi:two-component system, NarL family, captular synthesis response regulator RcsB